MEESSESTWQNSREMNPSSVSDRNLRNRPSYFDSEIRKVSDRVVLATDNLKKQFGISDVSEGEVGSDSYVRPNDWGDISLRQWLDKPERLVDEFECLHIFRQIVEIVHVAHAQGIVVQNIRPSCFVMSSFNHVSFIESASCSDSGSDSIEEGSNDQSNDVKNSSSSRFGNVLQHTSEEFQRSYTPNTLSEDSFIQSSLVNEAHVPLKIDFSRNKSSGMKTVDREDERRPLFPMKQVLSMETNWYTSPEEVAGTSDACASDIYRLGVILFELFCRFNSREEKRRTMSSLRHRVLPPQLLQKWPKVASFCLWLLHPDPCCRPKMSELLQSNFLNEPRENLEEREAATQLAQSIEENEMLLEFLLMMQKRKQEAIDKLQDTVALLSSDVGEVLKHYNDIRSNNLATDHSEHGVSGGVGSRKRFRFGLCSSTSEDIDNPRDETRVENPDNIILKNHRLMKNIKKLETAYFLTRCNPLKPTGKFHGKHSVPSNSGKKAAAAPATATTAERSISSFSSKEHQEDGKLGWIGPLLEGFCKYLAYSKLIVKADLKQGDLLNSANLVCSLGFDRDGEFFATAGINKKIKVFECDLLMNEDRDIHYPVVEMTSRAKLSSISWNSYIKSQIASSNFEGVVQVWDVTRNQVLAEMREHEKRVWSVDFSSADPTMLASGSDDCSVKLWNVNQGATIGTIKTKANVCSVQFSPDSCHFLAFGSADHKIYYYDLRSSKNPLNTLVGHAKTVSYVKFLSSAKIVSSSTDNTSKLWGLTTASRVVDTPLQTFTGHVNVKNFVGLSVSDGYIATGSETNEVFVYSKAFPMPAVSFKFHAAQSSGTEADDSAQFISSLCWRGRSTTLVAANSTGNIKILEMV